MSNQGAAETDPRPKVPMLSVVIKAYNEEANIARCLSSVVSAVDLTTTEIILADSLSADRTVAVAESFPVRIIQLARAADRSCGAAAQAGFQIARGQYLLLLDGDMALEPAFLPAALDRFAKNPALAGIGGHVIEMSQSLEYQQRNVRPDPDMLPGTVSQLSGGGLYRMEALRTVGYLANRNLHSCEEFELAIRLASKGWKLERIDVPYVRHWGHETPPYRLLASRWKNGYFRGPGEVIRGLLGTPLFPDAIQKARLFLSVVAWWICLAAVATIVAWGVRGSGVVLAILALLPLTALLLRKRSLSVAFYSFALWNVHAAALITGFFSTPTNPHHPIDCVVLR
jgi:glycosyltransferase involved in cell wall biosynthesis